MANHPNEPELDPYTGTEEEQRRRVFDAIPEAEEAQTRLRELLREQTWRLTPNFSQWECPLCGAVVQGKEKHTDWHLRNLQ